MKRILTKMFAAGALVALEAGVVLPALARAQAPQTKWNCFLAGQYQGRTDIWWGFTAGDAEWACNNWISACGNGGGCTAKPASAQVPTKNQGARVGLPGGGGSCRDAWGRGIC